MECKGKSRLISLYVDNMLKKDAKNALEAHIDTCSACKETLHSYTVMRDMIRHVYREDPIDVRSRVLKTILIPKKVMRGFFTVAAMLLLVVGGYFMGSYHHVNQPIPIVKIDDVHVTDSAQISSNTAETVKVRYENVSF